MCEIADRIRKEGRKEGRQEGRSEGRREGISVGIITSLKNLIKNANRPLEQAMAVLEIPDKDRPMYAGELGKIL